MRKYFNKTLVVAFLVVILLAVTVSAASASAGATYYTVRYGDTLFSIGRYYGVNPYHIAEVNNLPNPNCIYAGQVLYIPTYGGYYDGGYGYDGGGNRHDGYYDGGNYNGGYNDGGGYRRDGNYDGGYNDGGYRDVNYSRPRYDDGCYGYDCDNYNYGSNRHVVAYGETLTSIAYYYGVSPWAIANANHLYNLNCIYAGQVLYIPWDGYRSY